MIYTNVKDNSKLGIILFYFLAIFALLSHPKDTESLTGIIGTVTFVLTPFLVVFLFIYLIFFYF